MERLIESCDRGLVTLDLEVRTLDEAIDAMVDDMVNKNVVDAANRDEIVTEIKNREQISKSAIGHSLAVPHVYLECISEPLIAAARLKTGIYEDAPDGAPIRFVFLLIGPEGATTEHLDSLANVARLMSDDEFRYLALKAKTTEEFRAAIETRRSGKAAAEHHKSVDEGLQHTGRLFGGIIADVKRRVAVYKSDFTDGLHSKTAASTFFLFFACLAPAIIFGGLMSSETNGQIGAVEMIVATAFCGLVYALFAGQPMIILGGTGPMLVFTGILFRACTDRGVDPLPVYAWVGIWTGVILLILAITDASYLMKYFTRFTDEIFAALISIIFIYKAVEKLIQIFQKASNGGAIGYDVALLSLLLALGTFYIAYSMSAFRKSHLLVPSVREFLADFGPTIAIFSMAIVAVLADRNMDITAESLKAPDQFGTTDPDRGWLLRFWEADLSTILVCIIPALLCTVLVYLDQNITARLVNSRDNNLQKGESYHLDLGVVGILIGICSIFGLPWLVAATVRSLNHVRSLATTEEVVDQTGRAHTHILHVRENRITGVMIHLLIGLSLLALPLLKNIPMSVLFGLFLYMGVVSMSGNQFFQRLSLWATDPQMYPATHFVRNVPRSAMHLFTVIQLVCLVVLWVVKESAFGLLFPLFIAVLVPIRLLLNRIFRHEHLAFLDAEEMPEEEEETWS